MSGERFISLDIVRDGWVSGRTLEKLLNEFASSIVPIIRDHQNTLENQLTLIEGQRSEIKRLRQDLETERRLRLSQGIRK